MTINKLHKKIFSLITTAVLLVIVMVGLCFAADNYLIGPEDVLEVTVWDNKDLSSDVSVSLEGYITYQFIGDVKAEGLTTVELAKRIKELLADGYIVTPHVKVQLKEYRSKKIFIIGQANKPGTYYLTKKTTFVEAISMAMGPTKDADNEVIIVRPQADDPDVANSGALNVQNIVVDLNKALEGELSQNIFVQSGDSIYLSKAKTFFIMGEVNKPGQYNLEKATTVLKAISIAGGNTEKAALNRVKVVRDEDGKEVELLVEMSDMVRPFDTIVVPQSYF